MSDVLIEVHNKILNARVFATVAREQHLETPETPADQVLSCLIAAVTELADAMATMLDLKVPA